MHRVYTHRIKDDPDASYADTADAENKLVAGGGTVYAYIMPLIFRNSEMVQTVKGFEDKTRWCAHAYLNYFKYYILYFN